MTASDEVKRISTELKHLSLKRQQLLERKRILCIFQELRNRAEFGQTEEATSSQHEINNIEDKLKELIEKKAELQKTFDTILSAKEAAGTKKVDFTSSQKRLVGLVPGSNIFYVDSPPCIPAPTVILDVENLPPCPTRTQCPECREFIMTETSTSTSSVTWLVCFMSVMMGCVAGCCLLPFCMNRFKSVIHRCPKCRTPIHTVKKL
ncbi:uncharacterized protein LOC114439948 [Parambassis ranga]|uniref:Uncharacterized protein LOC114439948 n=1 Tax=Parambassis ranga TaxID=210632 RepID=A0A6P7IV14_9TELE|nr:uncharacterized protein LOC114439948 [Parambassis ranga]